MRDEYRSGDDQLQHTEAGVILSAMIVQEAAALLIESDCSELCTHNTIEPSRTIHN